MSDTNSHRWIDRDGTGEPCGLWICGLCGACSASKGAPCPGAAAIAEGERAADERIKLLAALFVAAERERCAKILSDYADTHAYDPEEHNDLLDVVEKIRSGE